MRKLILFDIDGTLLKPGDLAHQQALVEAVFAVYRVEASLEGVPLGGMLDSQIVRLALAKYDVPPDEIRAGLSEVMREMGVRYQTLLGGDERRSWLLPGVEPLIHRIAPQWTLSVLTGNASGVARAKLSAAGIDQFFPFGAYGDSADHRHELVPVAMEKMREKSGTMLDPADVVLVGDTPRDIEAARESGARVLAVATGRYSTSQLAELEPDALFEDLSDVKRVEETLAAMTAPDARSLPD